MTDFERAGRRVTFTLLMLQGLLSAGMSLVFVVGSIIMVDLAGGNRQWTGLPSTLMLVGAAVIAYPIGRLMDNAGRRIGLSLGTLFGIAGAIIAGWGAMGRLVIPFIGGITLMGMGRGVSELGRYAAAEANPPAHRGRAISLVVLGGTVGSIAGPSLMALAERLDEQLLPAGSAIWVLTAISFVIGLILIQALLRPDPREIAAHYTAGQADQPDPSDTGRSFRAILEDPRAVMAIIAMAFSQIAMVVVMTITPVHMKSHDHSLEGISLVLMAHTMGMFGLSFVTGWLVDRIGRIPMIVAGGIIAAVACVLAPVSTEIPMLALSLFLLGLGWNFGYIGGSSLLDDVLVAGEKGRNQGTVDAITKIAPGASTMGSGLVFSAIGFSLTSWITIVLALVPVAMVLLLRVRAKPAQLSEVPVQ